MATTRETIWQSQNTLWKLERTTHSNGNQQAWLTRLANNGQRKRYPTHKTGGAVSVAGPDNIPAYVIDGLYEVIEHIPYKASR